MVTDRRIHKWIKDSLRLGHAIEKIKSKLSHHGYDPDIVDKINNDLQEAGKGKPIPPEVFKWIDRSLRLGFDEESVREKLKEKGYDIGPVGRIKGSHVHEKSFFKEHFLVTHNVYEPLYKHGTGILTALGVILIIVFFLLTYMNVINIDFTFNRPEKDEGFKMIVLESDDMYKSTGAPIRDGWVLWQNGYFQRDVFFRKGSYNLRMIAKGTSAPWEKKLEIVSGQPRYMTAIPDPENPEGFPRMVIKVNSHHMNKLLVDSEEWKEYNTTIQITHDGVFQLEFEFDNDLVTVSEDGKEHDRNLALDKLIIEQTS
jgi:DNA-dependent RNA polymerase auxiliary subunit epsilon